MKILWYANSSKFLILICLKVCYFCWWFVNAICSGCALCSHQGQHFSVSCLTVYPLCVKHWSFGKNCMSLSSSPKHYLYSFLTTSRWWCFFFYASDHVLLLCFYLFLAGPQLVALSSSNKCHNICLQLISQWDKSGFQLIVILRKFFYSCLRTDQGLRWWIVAGLL